MTTTRVTLSLIGFAFLLLCAAEGATVKFKNSCGYTVWPGTLTGDKKPQLASTGFQLKSGESSIPFDLPSQWSGRFWGRTGCSYNNSRFSCASGDCASGEVQCKGAGAIPPASLVELTTASTGGEDFYDVSNVDGFNVPISVTPIGGSGSKCRTSSCSNDINSVCPSGFEVTVGGKVVACKSACLALNQPQYCCTEAYGTPETCPPTEYSQVFKRECPDAYSYAYDDKTSTFTCSGSPSYLITFCP